MNHFCLVQIGSFLEQLTIQESKLTALRVEIGGGAFLDTEQISNFKAQVKLAIDLSFPIGFNIALDQIVKLPLTYAKGKVDLSTAIASLNIIHHAFYDEMSKRNFLTVAPDRIGYLEAPPEIFPFKVTYQNFAFWGNAKDFGIIYSILDIQAAGNCLAAECHTAAVFHAMRVAEYGLRALAKKLKVKLNQDKKPLPIEFATWGAVIEGVKRQISKIRSSTQNAKRQKELAYYSDIADKCAYIKDLWRDDVSHARRQFNRVEAEGILGRVREFMQLLEKMP